MKYTKIIFLFFLYFGLHYIEGFPPVAGLPMAQLWKLPLIFILLIYFFKNIPPCESFEKWTWFIVIESFFCAEFFLNPFSVITSAIKYLPYVLFYHYFLRNFSIKILEQIILNLSRFVCLTSFITLVDLVQPVKGYLETSSFGIEDLSYYSSVFGAPHAASSYFAISIIILLYFQINNKYSSNFWKWINYILIGVALVSIFKAYVRTGWMMLIAGGVILVGIKQLITRIKFLFVATILTSCLFIFYNTNEAFQARMTGRNVYSDTGGKSIDMDGSGRREFWENGINLWMSGSPYEMLVGQGFTAVVDYNYKKMGIRVFSHNQFINTLAQNGFLGLVFLLIMYYQLYKYIKLHKRSRYYKICFSIFVMTLIFAFFQNEMYFDFAILYSACLALLGKTSSNITF